MSNPFFENNNWLLLTDAPVTGKSAHDFKPANLDSPYSVWGILREGLVYEKLITVFEPLIKNLSEKELQIDDRPLTSHEQNELLKNLKSKIDYYIENRPKPVDGYEIEMHDIQVLIDIRNNAAWDRPLSTMIRLYEILYNANETKNKIYLNMD